MATPALLGLLIFFVLPLLASIVLSFTDWSLLAAPSFVGVDNYVAMASDPLIAKSLGVTALYAILSVPTGVVAALLLATLLNQQVRANRVFVVLFYLPSVLPSVAVIVVWIWLLDPQFGIVNEALKGAGLPAPDWFGDPNMVIPSFVIMNVWGAGGSALIFLAARKGIPAPLYEAATLDGAGAVRQFFSITVPMLSPVIMFTVIIGLIGALQTFAQGFLLSGGDSDSALFFNLYLYNSAFQNGQMGYACAMAMLLFLLTLVLTAITFRTSSLWVFYENRRS